MQQAHLLKLESLRAKLRRNNVKRLSQVVRRKQTTIEQLRSKLRSAYMQCARHKMKTAKGRFIESCFDGSACKVDVSGCFAVFHRCSPF